MSALLRVAVVGALGRMGRFTRELLARSAGFEVVAAVGSREDLAAALARSGAAVAVDFTVAGRGAAHGAAMLEAGVRPLIGTSGVTPEDLERLDGLARARGLGGLVVPNFSRGVWLQQRLALEAVRWFGDVEIVEEHHADKVDAPSGTAADTARQLAAARGGDAPVPIHSLRLPGLYSNQTVVFGGPGEVLRLAHESYGLDAFGPGILAGLRYAARARDMRSGIGHAFEADLRPAAGDA